MGWFSRKDTHKIQPNPPKPADEAQAKGALIEVRVSAGSPTPPAEPSHMQRSASPESVEADDDLHAYLFGNFAPPTAADLERSCWELADKLREQEHSNLDDLSLHVQTFYQRLADRAARAQHADFSATAFLERVERFVSVRAHRYLFCTRTDEEVVDLSLQERIRSLHWVTQGFLETPLDFDSAQVEECLDDAVNEIVYMNSHRAIAEKLDCLIRCSKRIFDALRESSEAPASADEFLPVLIYVLIKSNPPLIQSNLNFISRFAYPMRISRGESGYFFTNLCCALQFIQDMNHESLHMSKEDFEAYTSGTKKAPTARRSHISATKSLESSLKKLAVLSENQRKLSEKADALVSTTFSAISELKQKIEQAESRKFAEPPTIKLRATGNGKFDVVEVHSDGTERIVTDLREKTEATSSRDVDARSDEAVHGDSEVARDKSDVVHDDAADDESGGNARNEESSKESEGNSEESEETAEKPGEKNEENEESSGKTEGNSVPNEESAAKPGK